MAAVLTTPTWTDNLVAVVNMAVLNNNAGANFLRSGTIDLRAKHGAELFVRMGPTAATVPASAILVHINRVANNLAAQGNHPVGIGPLTGSVAARNATTLSALISAGATTFTITSATGWVNGDIGIIMDSVSAPTKIEFFRVAKAGTTTTPVRPIVQAFANAAPVVRVADVFSPIWLMGGSVYEVIFDYSAAATGSDYIVEAFAQTYDNDSTV